MNISSEYSRYTCWTILQGGAKPLTIKVLDFDRAAPHGTGHIKAGLNYAMSLHAIVTAHEEGYAENMYLTQQQEQRLKRQAELTSSS